MSGFLPHDLVMNGIPHAGPQQTMMLGKSEGKRRRGQQRMRWYESITDGTDVNLSKLQETVKDRGAWSAAVRGITKSWT